MGFLLPFSHSLHHSRKYPKVHSEQKDHNQRGNTPQEKQTPFICTKASKKKKKEKKWGALFSSCTKKLETLPELCVSFRTPLNL